MTFSVPVLASGSLDNYIQTVNAIPVLDADEEKNLAIRYRDDNDLVAAQALVVSQLKGVVRVARGFMGYGLPLADLVQEGNIGLMKAVKRFDPGRDVRLVSFAVHWIRAEMFEYILKNWRIAKVATTKSQRKLFFNLRQSREKLGWMKEDEVHQLARELDVSPSSVREMESRMSGGDIPFDIRDDGDDDNSSSFTPAAWLADDSASPETLLLEKTSDSEASNDLSRALASLDERSRDIVSSRWLSEDSKATLQSLADKYGVSAERIRQIEKRALGTMKKALSVSEDIAA